VGDASDYDRLALDRLSELNRAARDVRYRTNIEFGISQARRLAALVLAVAAAVTGGAQIAAGVADALAPGDQPAKITPAPTDREGHGK
jgi:hypothetical protein